MAAFLLFGCTKAEPSARPNDTSGKGASTMRLISPAFQHQSEIPTQFTCEGEDVSPPLSWSEVPDGTQSLALVVDDPDAPDPAAPKRVWVHWVLYDIPPSVSSLPQAMARVPDGARDGVNDWGRAGYGGPCPPIGRHRYFHKLYALDAVLGDKGRLKKADLEAAMQGHVLATAELIGTYEKTGK